MTLKEFLKSIADAIRAKEGSTGDIPAPTFAQRILAIVTGVELPTLTNPGAASDLRQGKQLIDQEGNAVNGALPDVEQATPSISVSSAGLITASAQQSAGYVSGGSKSATRQLPTQAGKTVTPTSSEQLAVSAGTFVTGDIKVAAASGDDVIVDMQDFSSWDGRYLTINTSHKIKKITNLTFSGENEDVTSDGDEETLFGYREPYLENANIWACFFYYDRSSRANTKFNRLGLTYNITVGEQFITLDFENFISTNFSRTPSVTLVVSYIKA